MLLIIFLIFVVGGAPFYQQIYFVENKHELVFVLRRHFRGQLVINHLTQFRVYTRVVHGEINGLYK
jgi:hypothetical protein